MNLDEHFADITNDAPGCAAAIVSGDSIVWQGCFGRADIARNEAVTAASRFRIASITKPMVAMTALALSDAGVIAFSDAITRWLPEMRCPRPPTIGQLLSMKSGLYELAPLAFLAGSREGGADWSLDTQVALAVAQTGQAFAPGHRTLYANINYILVQRALERATGQGLAALLQAHVFTPAGMAGAALHDGALPPGMGWSHEGPDHLPTDRRGHFGGAGAVIASLDDMTGFAGWMAGNPGDWQARLVGPVFHDDGSASGYAHGIQRQRLAGIDVRGHAGNIDGWSGEWLFAPDTGVAAVILGNRADLNWYERIRELLSAHLGLAGDPAMTPRLVRRDPPPPRWTARYASIDPGASLALAGADRELVMEGRRLPMQADGSFARNLGVEPITLLAPDIAEPPATIVRREGNQSVVLTRVDPGSLPPPLPAGDYGHPDLPYPLRVGHADDGSPWCETGPAWPPSPRYPLLHVIDGLYRAHSPDGAALDFHLRFASGDPFAVLAAFSRLPALRLTRRP